MSNATYCYMPVKDANYTKLHELVTMYHRRTELFDRGICTGESRYGDAFPATSRERSEIKKHAKMVFAELQKESIRLEFSSSEWQVAVARGNHDLPDLLSLNANGSLSGSMIMERMVR